MVAAIAPAVAHAAERDARDVEAGAAELTAWPAWRLASTRRGSHADLELATAYQLLHRATRVQRGQRVLVQAAAGAVLTPTQSRQALPDRPIPDKRALNRDWELHFAIFR